MNIEISVIRDECSSMTETAAALEKEALALSIRDRIEIAERILCSVDDFADSSLKAEWDREIEKRSDEIRTGTVQGIDSEKAFKKARRLLNE